MNLRKRSLKEASKIILKKNKTLLSSVLKSKMIATSNKRNERSIATRSELKQIVPIKREVTKKVVENEVSTNITKKKGRPAKIRIELI